MITDSIAEASVWGDWALDRATAIDLAAAYYREQPRVIVEAGSGYSTVIAAEYARDSGATVISLDHSKEFEQKTLSILKSHGLDRYVDLRHASITEISTAKFGGQSSVPWYNTELPRDIDFALIDGPPGKIGRRGALYGLYDNLSGTRWTLLLDDAGRKGEQDALLEWQLNFGVNVRMVQLPRPLAIVSSESISPVAVSGLVVTILTGDRPKYFIDTIRSIEDAAPGLLSSSYLIVCHNGGNGKTREAIDIIPAVNEIIPIGNNGMVSLGEAMSAISNRLVTAFGHGEWIHLEDDWVAATTAPAQWWLAEASRILKLHADVGQVRLRHRCESTHKKNLRTGKPITWTPLDSHTLISETAHYTCNPAMMRIQDIGNIWPAPGENAAMDNFARTGLKVAQLSPGVFHHIGGENSLEGHLVKPARLAMPTNPARRKSRHAKRLKAQQEIKPARKRIAIASEMKRLMREAQQDKASHYDIEKETDSLRGIASIAGWEPGDTVYDIGAGNGMHSGILAALGFSVVAVDIADSCIRNIEKNYPNVQAVKADATIWRPSQKANLFARGMSWFNWELDGVNVSGIDVPVVTRALVRRALCSECSFVIQAWTDLSGEYGVGRMHNNKLCDYRKLLEPIFEHVDIFDWSGSHIVPGMRHDRGVIIVSRGIK